MIRLLFEEGSHKATLGPAPWFRIAGNFIRQGPHGTIAGTFRMHHWEVGGYHYSRYDCTAPVRIHFEEIFGGKSEEFGPFPTMFGQDGVIHAGDGLFAKFIEETQMWHCFPTENFWPIIVIRSASETITA